MKFYPYTWEHEVLAIVMGGLKKFPHFKRGGTTSFTLYSGGGGAQIVSDPRFSNFVAPPLPIINDQSLNTKFSM